MQEVASRPAESTRVTTKSSTNNSSRRKTALSSEDALNRTEQGSKISKLDVNADKVEPSFIDDEDSISDELEVIRSRENQDYFNRLCVGKLTRLARHRSLWNNEFNAYFVVLIFLLTFDVLVQFSMHLNKYGTAFLPAYTISMIFVSFPLLYLELALGQYTSSTSYHIFDRMAPAFAGLGIASMVFNFFKILSETAMLRIFLQFLSKAANFLGAGLPWNSCNNDHNSGRCFHSKNPCMMLNFSPSPDEEKASSFFLGIKRDVCFITDIPAMHSQMERGLETQEGIDWIRNEAMGQFMFWNINFDKLTVPYYPSISFIILTFVCVSLLYIISQSSNRIIMSVAKAGIIVLVSVIFILTLHFLSAVEIPPQILRPVHFFDVLDSHMWISAVLLSLSALKVGQGGLSYLGAQNKFNHNLMRNSFLYLIIMIFMPMFYAVIHLMIIHNSTSYINRDKFVDHPTMKRYISHPIIQILFLMQGMNSTNETYGIFFFCIMGILLVLCNSLIRLEILVSSMIEAFPFFTYDGRNSRSAVVCIILCFVFMYSFLFVSSNGFAIQLALDDLVYPDIVLVIILFQLLAVCCCYGPKRLFTNISCMIHSTKIDVFFSNIFNMIVAILWTVVIPAVVLFVLYSRVKQQYESDYANILEVPSLIRFGILSLIPVIMFQRLMNYYAVGKDIFALFKPHRELWGPKSKKDRDRVHKKEKEFLIQY